MINKGDGCDMAYKVWDGRPLHHKNKQQVAKRLVEWRPKNATTPQKRPK